MKAMSEDLLVHAVPQSSGKLFRAALQLAGKLYRARGKLDAKHSGIAPRPDQQHALNKI